MALDMNEGIKRREVKLKMLNRLEINDRRGLVICSGILGMIFSIFSVLGYQLEKNKNIDFSSGILYVQIILFGILFAIITFILFLLFQQLNLSNKQYNCGMKSFLLTAAFIFIAWMPALIGCYPGFFNYDSSAQWSMYINDKITAHHPPIHTWLLGTIIELVNKLTNSMLNGVFFFCCFQMVIFACCFSYVIHYLRMKKLPRYVILLSCCWFAFFPTCVINVLSITKDNFFAAFLMVFLTMTLQVLEEPDKYLKSKRFVFAWAAVTVLTAITRNNAIYVVALFLVFLLFLLRKSWKKVLIAYACMSVLFFLYIGVFCPLIVTDGVNPQEFLSVPTQQLMRVYKEKESELSIEEKEIYHKLFKDEAFEKYDPKISDNVKKNFNTEVFEENKAEYIKFYFNMGRQYPKTYLNSFLHNTYGFWYPKAKMVLNSKGLEGYFVCWSQIGSKTPSLIPFIWDYYQLFINSKLVYGDSFSVVFFAPASFFWLSLLVTGYLIWKKKKKELVVISVMLLLWMTFLFGPVAIVRYVSFLFFAVPLEVSFLFGTNNNAN